MMLGIAKLTIWQGMHMQESHVVLSSRMVGYPVQIVDMLVVRLAN